MKARVLLDNTVKRTLQQALQKLKAARIPPSEDYYINIKKAGETWNDGEFCPIGVDEHGGTTQFDGMYDLANDAAIATGYDGTANEEAYTAVMDAYEGKMHEDIRAGRTWGLIGGKIGIRAWRLVYLPHGKNVEHATTVVPGQPLPNAKS